MRIFDHIHTAEQLKDFVDELNGLSLFHRYIAFERFLQPKIHDLRPNNFPVTKDSHYQQWWFAIKEFVVFTTVKINKLNPTKNPDLKTGFYENIYFHLNPDDTSGISHNQ